MSNFTKCPCCGGSEITERIIKGRKEYLCTNIGCYAVWWESIDTLYFHSNKRVSVDKNDNSSLCNGCGFDFEEKETPNLKLYLTRNTQILSPGETHRFYRLCNFCSNCTVGNLPIYGIHAQVTNEELGRIMVRIFNNLNTKIDNLDMQIDQVSRVFNTDI